MNTITKYNGLKYEPEQWKEITIRYCTNCYCYAINQIINPITKTVFDNWNHTQPGNLGGKNNIIKDWKNLPEDQVLKTIIDSTNYDLHFLGLQIIPSTFEEVIEDEDIWKVALCFCFDNIRDYHWYRQNNDGTWSHKCGTYEVKNTDEVDKVIINPEECNRGIYTNFAGFFIIKKLPKIIKKECLENGRIKEIHFYEDNRISIFYYENEQVKKAFCFEEIYKYKGE